LNVYINIAKLYFGVVGWLGFNGTFSTNRPYRAIYFGVANNEKQTVN